MEKERTDIQSLYNSSIFAINHKTDEQLFVMLLSVRWILHFYQSLYYNFVERRSHRIS
jgi:hypothetical protein